MQTTLRFAGQLVAERPDGASTDGMLALTDDDDEDDDEDDDDA